MSRSLAQPRPSLIVLGLVVLLAVLGWGMYLSVKAGYDVQQGRFNQERTELAGRVADLEGALTSERATSSSRIAALDDALAKERAAEGDLAALEARIDRAKSALNQRLSLLGEREHDLAGAAAALTEAQSRLAAIADAQETAAGRLNHRLQVLGERELDLAGAERALGHARTGRDRLQAEVAALDRTLASGKAGLGALNVEIARLVRERSKSARDLEHARSELAGTEATLGALEARLDKAHLAQSVAELTAHQTALRQEVTSLNAELEHKQPLFHESVNVNQQLLDLDDQLGSLAAERAKLTDKLQQLVARLGQPLAARAVDSEQAPESLAKLIGQ